MLTVTCPCGKLTYGSEAMAGEAAQCLKCGRMVTFPAPASLQPAAAPAAPLGLDPVGSPFGEEPAPLPPPAAAPAPPSGRRRPCEYLYWALLLTLLPLVSVLLRDDDTRDLRKRLQKTLDAHPEVKIYLKHLAQTPGATIEDVFKILPGHRLDDLAYLPRDTRAHWAFAGASALGFFLLVGVVMAWRITPPWMLLLNAAFTATFGIAFLFLLHDFIGDSYQLTLSPQRSFLANLLGFTLVVGLGEELCKSLPVIFYLRTFRSADWRGAYLWGLASGVGFGIAEGITYSARMYNGIAPADVYLTRFAACVALHAVWSASVGITLFQSRRLVGQVLNAVLYGGSFSREEVAWVVLRVLGVAMLLHGLYDTLLTQDLIPLALLVALASFAWLGWQIETLRDREAPAAVTA